MSWARAAEPHWSILPDGPARLQVTTMDHNDFVGRIAIGRVDRGHIREGQDLVVCGGEGEPCEFLKLSCP